MVEENKEKILQYILSGALEDHYQFETKTSHTAVKKAMDLPIDETFIETLRQSFVKAYHDWIVTTNATRASNAYQKPLDSEDLESQLAYNASFMVLTTPDKPFTLEPEIQAMIDKYSLTPEK